MEVRLKVLKGSKAGAEIAVPAPKFFIGRAEDCHLKPKSDLISRHHCVLLIEEGYVAVRDLGSRNGTHVNGEPISGERELHAGDTLLVGPLEFELRVLAPKKRPKVTSVKEAATRAAESTMPGENDITQWVGTGLPETANAATRELTSAETEEIRVGSTMVEGITGATSSFETEPPAAPVSTHAPPNRATPPPPTDRKKPGKLPPLPKADNSRAAAADVLSKYFRRR